MTEDLTHIMIFKTNITTFSDKLSVQKLFSEILTIDDWHVDSEDVDYVLRVVSYDYNADQIISQINSIGFQCEELL